MRRLTTDFLILLLVSMPVLALAFLMPKSDMRIERNWSVVAYSPPVSTGEATGFADLMERMGIFAGNPLYFKLQRDDDKWIVMTIPNPNYKASVDRDAMVGLGKVICGSAFPGQTVSFKLLDEDLEPFDEIVPPTLFPER